MESERKKNVCTHPNTKSRITGLESTLYNLLKCCYCNCLVGSVIQEFLVLERHSVHSVTLIIQIFQLKHRPAAVKPEVKGHRKCNKDRVQSTKCQLQSFEVHCNKNRKITLKKDFFIVYNTFFKTESDIEPN